MRTVVKSSVGIFVMLILLLQSCAPSMSAEWQKEAYSGSSQENILVMAISNDLQVRQNLEQETIARLKKEFPNKKFQMGTAIFPPNQDLKKLSETEIEQKVKDAHADMILTIGIVNTYVSQDYNMGNTAYIPSYNRFGRYIYRTYDVISTPGYYSNNQNYVLDANLFDAEMGSTATDALVWKGQSQVSNPSSIQSGAKTYASNLVSYLKLKQILK